MLRHTLVAAMFACWIILAIPPNVANAGGKTPTRDLVSDEKTAIAIARAILIPIYGEEKIDREKPYIATLQGGVWTVEGSVPRGRLGGAFEIKIRKSDAQVLDYGHWK